MDGTLRIEADRITAWVIIDDCDGSDYITHMPTWSPAEGGWWPEDDEFAIGYLPPGKEFVVAEWEASARRHVESQRQVREYRLKANQVGTAS